MESSVRKNVFSSDECYDIVYFLAADAPGFDAKNIRGGAGRGGH